MPSIGPMTLLFFDRSPISNCPFISSDLYDQVLRRWNSLFLLQLCCLKRTLPNISIFRCNKIFDVLPRNAANIIKGCQYCSAAKTRKNLPSDLRRIPQYRKQMKLEIILVLTIKGVWNQRLDRPRLVFFGPLVDFLFPIWYLACYNYIILANYSVRFQNFELINRQLLNDHCPCVRNNHIPPTICVCRAAPLQSRPSCQCGATTQTQNKAGIFWWIFHIVPNRF